MKKYLFIFIALIIFPSISSASSIPKFPMAFYGNVTINGTKAPEGTIISAYYGTTLAGQSTVDSSGAYGSIASTANKLLVSEGSGAITFTFKSSSILSGAESKGTTLMSYSSFTEGSTITKDLAFTYYVAPVGGGGGGGGGGGSSPSPIIIAKPVTVVNPIIPIIAPVVDSSIPGCGDRTTGFSYINGQSCIKNLVTKNTTPVYNPTNYLSNSTPIKYNLGTKTLKNGSTGDAVKELQRYLNDTMNLGLVIDGKLGPKTIAIIKKWQISKGLVPDGLIGPKTKAMMR
ncbi:MAG: peptidoglycan-binding domain-containing protein [Candidatus Nomurabacteria bacterium]